MLLDASGSMQDCYDVTIAALNGQIKSLREVQEKYPDQDVRFAISDFSNDYRLWFAPRSIHDVFEVSNEQYQLRGATALWDGLGTLITRTIDEVGSDAPETGTSVSIMVLTDGFENASRTFSPGALRLLMDMLKNKGWVSLAPILTPLRSAGIWVLNPIKSGVFRSARWIGHSATCRSKSTPF